MGAPPPCRFFWVRIHFIYRLATSLLAIISYANYAKLYSYANYTSYFLRTTF